MHLEQEYNLLFINNLGGTFHFPVNKDLIQKKEKKSLVYLSFLQSLFEKYEAKRVVFYDLLNLSLHSTCKQLCMLEGKETVNKRAAICNARLNSACLLRKKNVNATLQCSNGLGAVVSHIWVQGQSLLLISER